MGKELYLDNAATTKVYPEVVKEMKEFFLNDYGNPGSIHNYGERAFKAITNARIKLARKINAKPEEIIFTSGGTESDNWAIKGLVEHYPHRKKIIISSIEHPAVYESCNYLKSKNYDVVEIDVNNDGIIDIAKLEKEIDQSTLLVSIMHINNEIGVIQDLKNIGEICRKKGVIFHTDAVQSFSKEKIDVVNDKIDLLSASAHKIGGPKGIGFLYVRNGLQIKPLLNGGGQERGLRSGTENVPGIIGFAKALEIANSVDKEKIKKIRDKIKNGLERIGGNINGSWEKRVYNNINASFENVNGEALVIALSLKGIYCSTGSACSSRNQKESRTLKAIGLNEKEIQGSLRITINEDIKNNDVKIIVDEIKKAVDKLRK